MFTDDLVPTARGVGDFFARPKDFLEQTIENLAPECEPLLPFYS